MVIELGLAKHGRFDSADNNETTEIIERPGGGETVIFCRGMRNEQQSKTISSVIVNNILQKITEDFRDSTAIRSVSDQFYREYTGGIRGDLCMISADFETRTIVVSRCTPYPVYYYQRGITNAWHAPCEQICSEKGVRPSLTEVPMEPGTVILMLSRGILNAGKESNESIEFEDLIQRLCEEDNELSADSIAEFILKNALKMDSYEPKDDMTAIVLKVTGDAPSSVTKTIRMTLPVPNYQSIFD